MSTIEEKHTCCADVRHGSFYRYTKCGKTAKFEVNGRHYCGTHNPNKAPTKAQVAAKVEYEIRQKRWQIERAAPDLLEALQAFVNHGTCYSSDEMQKAKDAIAKATGEQA